MGTDLVYSAHALCKQHSAHPLIVLFKNGAAMVTMANHCGLHSLPNPVLLAFIQWGNYLTNDFPFILAFWNLRLKLSAQLERKQPGIMVLLFCYFLLIISLLQLTASSLSYKFIIRNRHNSDI